VARNRSAIVPAPPAPPAAAPPAAALRVVPAAPAPPDEVSACLGPLARLLLRLAEGGDKNDPGRSPPQQQTGPGV
jgi:hypothetical protein